jgi:uncharacterized membrane protein YcaP (DUF421 family)
VDELWRALRLALGLGLEGKELTAAQMALRAAVVYAAVVLLVRLGKRRFMGRASAFDVILGIMLGSVASRGITGNAPLGPTLAAAAALLAMHWAASALAVRWHPFGEAVKGRPVVLVREGRIEEAAMRAAHLTERDLHEGLRRHGLTSAERVAEARLERNGDISVVRAAAPAERAPRVAEVRVAEGVQTVRLELG